MIVRRASLARTAFCDNSVRCALVRDAIRAFPFAVSLLIRSGPLSRNSPERNILRALVEPFLAMAVRCSGDKPIKTVRARSRLAQPQETVFLDFRRLLKTSTVSPHSQTHFHKGPRFVDRRYSTAVNLPNGMPARFSGFVPRLLFGFSVAHRGHNPLDHSPGEGSIMEQPEHPRRFTRSPRNRMDPSSPWLAQQKGSSVAWRV